MGGLRVVHLGCRKEVFMINNRSNLRVPLAVLEYLARVGRFIVLASPGFLFLLHWLLRGFDPKRALA